MKDLLSFLSEYKEVLISSVCLIFTIICIIVKRRPKTLDDIFLCMSEVLPHLPHLIKVAESDYSKGSLKKDEVINAALLLAEGFLKRDLSDTEKKYFIKFISDSIEDILSTPQKKEVSSC